MKIDKDAQMNQQLTHDRINPVFLLVLLVVVSLFLGLLPALSFGQSGFAAAPPAAVPAVPVAENSVPTLEPPSVEPSPMKSFTSPPAKAASEPAPVDFSPPSALSSVPATPNTSVASSLTPPTNEPPPPSQRPPKAQRHIPTQLPTQSPIASVPGSNSLSNPNFSAPTASVNLPKEPTAKELQDRPELLRSVADPNHPFAQYFDLPKTPNSTIKGKSFTIAQLLDGTRTSGSRSQLLQTYWELAGLLTEYNIRCEAERIIGSVRDAQQNLAVNLLQQQRRSAEIEFAKKQWQLTELLKRTKGVTLAESDLPIPCDYPLFKRYETYADKIARTDRTRYLGHLIPIQEQLIDAKQRRCSAMFEMLKNIPPNSQQLVDMLNQRTGAYLDMVETVIDYNKMIAEYTAETIAPNITGYRLVGALIELPKSDAVVPAPKPMEQAAPPTLKLSGNLMRPAELPPTMFAPQQLPAAQRPFPPISQPVVQTSYVEEQ